MSKFKLATVWLDGCSGCHMSLLDLDEGILTIAPKIDLVYSPLVDAAAFPEMVDATLVEGAVSRRMPPSCAWSARTPACWFPWVIVPLPATYPRCATPSRSSNFCSAFTSRAPPPAPSSPAPEFRPCCRRPVQCMSS